MVHDESYKYWVSGSIILTALIFGAIYLVSFSNLNSQVSLLNAKLDKLQGTATTAPTAKGNVDLSFASADPAVGTNSKVSVIEFSDFQCPFCGIAFGREYGGSQYDQSRGSEKQLRDLASQGKLKFVFHTVAFLGQESVYAAEASFCARDQLGDAGFFAMHDALFTAQNGENQGAFTKDKLKVIAQKVQGLDVNKFNSCLDGDTKLSAVQQSTQQANSAGVKGTPGWYIVCSSGSQQFISGAAPYSQIQSAVNACA